MKNTTKTRPYKRAWSVKTKCHCLSSLPLPSSFPCSPLPVLSPKIHTHAFTCAHTKTFTTHTHIHIHMHAHTHMHTHVCNQAHMCTHAHIHTHTHTHTSVTSVIVDTKCSVALNSRIALGRNDQKKWFILVFRLMILPDITLEDVWVISSSLKGYVGSARIALDLCSVAGENGHSLWGRDLNYSMCRQVISGLC